jgi:phenylpropionate dioxygenase-like ring-hydroxylating dioxygenase large terminal subunit
MLTDSVLLNDWHVVAYAPSLQEGKPIGVRLLDEDIVLWRVSEKIYAWRDLCVHRGTRLSLGKVENRTLICPYHGWVYNEEGRCIRFPAHPQQKPPATARVKVYALQEKYNWVWIRLGNAAHDIPPFAEWGNTAFHLIHCGPYPL